MITRATRRSQPRRCRWKCTRRQAAGTRPCWITPHALRCAGLCLAGNLTDLQFDRLKAELEQAFSGQSNAGRPILLEGGLDWKPLALTPKDMDFQEARNGAAREIALAFGVPPLLLGLPGDNTYSNYVEANRAFWRQTIVPLVRRVSSGIAQWLQPAYAARITILPDLDQIEAIAEDRAALWKRVSEATFLTDEEKRAALDYGTAAKARPARHSGRP